MSLVLVLTCTSSVNIVLRSGLPVVTMIIKSDDSSFGTEEETRHRHNVQQRIVTVPFHAPINNASTYQNAKANVGKKIFIYIQD